jgi:hypothetical protein
MGRGVGGWEELGGREEWGLGGEGDPQQRESRVRNRLHEGGGNVRNEREEVSQGLR